MTWKAVLGVGALAVLAIFGAQASGTAASAGAPLVPVETTEL